MWRRQAWDQQFTLAVWLFSLLIHPAGLLPTSSEKATGASIEVWSFCFMLWNSTAGQQLLSLLWGELRVGFFQCEQRACWEQRIQTPEWLDWEWLHRAEIAVISALQTFHVINRLALNNYWKCVLVSTWRHCFFLFWNRKEHQSSNMLKVRYSLHFQVSCLLKFQFRYMNDEISITFLINQLDIWSVKCLKMVKRVDQCLLYLTITQIK